MLCLAVSIKKHSILSRKLHEMNANVNQTNEILSQYRTFDLNIQFADSVVKLNTLNYVFF